MSRVIERVLGWLRSLARRAGRAATSRAGARPLTPAEAARAARVFGAAIDLAPVRITRGRLASRGAARTLGNTIHLREGDFAGAGPDLTPAGLHLLVHELTHVWQFQRGGAGYFPASMLAQGLAWLRTGDRRGAYEWRPREAAGVPFERWNPEQQARAVEDYDRLLTRRERGESGAGDLAALAGLQRHVDAIRASRR